MGKILGQVGFVECVGQGDVMYKLCVAVAGDFGIDIEGDGHLHGLAGLQNLFLTDAQPERIAAKGVTLKLAVPAITRSVGFVAS